MFLIPCGNHAHIGGGSYVEILRSTLANVWVERCSDLVGCRTSFFQDKYFLCVISTTVFCLMNCDEHVECLMDVFASTIYCMFYTSVYVFKFNAFLNYIMGLRLSDW